MRGFFLLLFFHNFVTFISKPGIYLEDLYGKDEFHGQQIGKNMLVYLDTLAKNVIAVGLNSQFLIEINQQLIFI